MGVDIADVAGVANVEWRLDVGDGVLGMLNDVDTPDVVAVVGVPAVPASGVGSEREAHPQTKLATAAKVAKPPAMRLSNAVAAKYTNSPELSEIKQRCFTV